ncbi:hypothetical protein FRC04_009599 [Tulasnella sp. 424]|nr:hypothetical protein FRC04_009599 [Tulasnella sp. 424]KAG8975899.1 hypothetical protein FRC05_004829 [Tulasnella sp. 425]
MNARDISQALKDLHDVTQRLPALLIAGEFIAEVQSSWERKQPAERLMGDSQLQKDSRADFVNFERSVKNLEEDLETFMRAVRPVGSSSGLIRAAKKLDEEITVILNQMRYTTAKIWTKFATSKERPHSKLPEDLQNVKTLAASWKLAKSFQTLSDTLQEFLDSLQDIPEFEDKRLTDSLEAFHHWLNYRANTLSAYSGTPFENSAADWRYMSQVMAEMIVYVKKTGRALKEFAGDGVKAIREAQDRSQSWLQNISTVATFFSAVTATTLQYSMNGGQNLGTVVRAFWVSSLILSIASAINSQLAMHWRTAMYRSPRGALPMWASFCLNHAPIACLVAAVLTFSVGLVAWTFASNLGIVVTACAITLTAATAIILVAVVVWETGERLREYKREFREYGVNPFLRSLKYPYALVRPTLSGSSPGLTAWLRQKWRFAFGSPIHHDRSNHVASEDRPGGESRVATPAHEDSIDDTKSGPPTIDLSLEPPQHLPPKWQSRKLHLKRPTLQPVLLGVPTVHSDQVPDTPFSPTSPALEEHASTPVLQRTFRKRAWDLAHDKNLRAVIRSTPMGTTGYRRNELNNIRPVRCLLSERPIGRDMHFSPDGSYLAVSRVDGMVAIWNVDNFDEYPITIPAPTERFAWSPDGAYIVSILPKGFQIWNRNRRRFITPHVSDSIGPVAWLHHGAMFAAAVDGEVHVYSKNGTLKKEFEDLSRSRLQIHDIATIPSTNQDQSPGRKFGTLLLVGTVVAEVADPSSEKPEFQRPRDAKPERRLVVYDMDWNGEGQAQARASVEASILADTQGVAVTRNGMFGLLSYGDGSFPELWQLRDSKDRVRLELCRVYAPSTTGSSDQKKAMSPRVVGKAHFGGETDEWVIACNGENEIYVWDRATGHMLHTLRSTQIQEFASDLNAYDLATFACRTVRDNTTGMMLASASTSGGVIIWQSPSDREAQSPASGSLTSPEGLVGPGSEVVATGSGSGEKRAMLDNGLKA